MNKPSSFSTICTKNCAFELTGLLLSLSIYHPNEKIYILCDTYSKEEIEKLTPKVKLNITWIIKLDKYSNLNREQMVKLQIWSDFQMSKAEVIKYALEKESDTLFLDSDIVITGIICDIDFSKDLGLSPGYISKKKMLQVGFFNGGFLWVKNKDIPNDWIEFTKTSRYFDQASLEDLAEKYDYFEFGENYNIQYSRFPIDRTNIKGYIKKFNRFKYKDEEIYYRNKKLKCIHTHFLMPYLFNEFFIKFLIKHKVYKLLLIIYRIINNKWLIKIPKQQRGTKFFHENDSFRELARLFTFKNKDLFFTYDKKIKNCWLSPNIVLYDRPTLDWLSSNINLGSIFLLGNDDIETCKPIIQEKYKNLHVKPWIFWPRYPTILEKILEKKILSYSERKIHSIFIGNYQTNIQKKFRKTDANWKEVVSEFHCTMGKKHKFSAEEYLLMLRDSKFGLCLRGFGKKCHREVELMAFGTIPLITEHVNTTSYQEPLIENKHYIFVKSPSDLKHKLENIDKKIWEDMSKECYEWYQRNVHSDNAWETMIKNILYT